MTDLPDPTPPLNSPVVAYTGPQAHEEPQPFSRERGAALSGDRGLRLLTASAGVVTLLLLGTLLFVLIGASIPTIREYGVSFLAKSDWKPNYQSDVTLRGPDGKILRDEDGDPIKGDIPPKFGALPAIYGTAVTSAIALLFAVPLSFGAAIFLTRIAPRILVPPVSFLIEFLAAIPSIAYGIWGLFVLAPFLGGGVRLWGFLTWLPKAPGCGWLFTNYATFDQPAADRFIGVEPILKATLGKLPFTDWMFYTQGYYGREKVFFTGRDMLCGGLILAIMIVPIITAISRDVLRQVPREQVDGSIALGATWWQSVKETLLFSRSALFGAVMLGLARAAGETMAITLVIGGVMQVKASPFSPAQTMSSLLASQFGEASELQLSALAEVALILLVMSLVFNVVARYLVVGKGSRSAAAH